jgi:hypothetical protein
MMMDDAGVEVVEDSINAFHEDEEDDEAAEGGKEELKLWVNKAVWQGKTEYNK